PLFFGRSSSAATTPGVPQERLRTTISRACKASGTPTWSPHDLRHRRISLWHRQGETWALIGARVGQRSLSVTADTYTHVLLDDRELDQVTLLDDITIRDRWPIGQANTSLLQGLRAGSTGTITEWSAVSAHHALRHTLPKPRVAGSIPVVRFLSFGLDAAESR